MQSAVESGRKDAVHRVGDVANGQSQGADSAGDGSRCQLCGELPAFEDGDVVASCQGCNVEGVGDVELGFGTGEERHQAPEKNVELHIGQSLCGDLSRFFLYPQVGGCQMELCFMIFF